MKTLAILLLSLLSIAEAAPCAEIRVDLSQTVKPNLRSGAAGANLCWLLASERKQSLKTALREMGCGALRFPYGALADNYLWHTPPFSDTENGLRPRVAIRKHTPGKWSWAVNPNGSFKDAMDFDQYMQLCDRLSIQPLVVVNILSDTFRDDITYDQLKQSAVEWVRYAKQKGYRVAYWQIGNEVDHHSKRSFFTPESYSERYRDITTAMKAADSTIRTGPGLIGHLRYFWRLMEIAPDQIDFVSAHQYMHGRKESCGTYQKWKTDDSSYIPNVEAMQRAVSKSPKPDLEILITETGVTPANEELGRINNTYKALWWFEVLMNQISTPNVSYSFFWGVHTPWQGPGEPDSDVGTLLTRTNKPKPTGQVSTLVNRALLDRMVEMPRQVGTIRSYATASRSGDRLNLLLMNKEHQSQGLLIHLENDSAGFRRFKRTVFQGSSPEDRTPVTRSGKTVSTHNKKLRLTLPPVSLTLLEQTI